MQQYCPGYVCTPALAAAAPVLFGPTVTLAGVPGPYGAVKIGLIGALNGAASANQVFANITLPVYDTYAIGATVVWGVELNEHDGTLTCSSQLETFQQTGAGGDTIVGAYLSFTGPVVYAICTFLTPIVLVNSGDGFTILAEWNIQANQSAAIPAVAFQVNS
jgi:hypothetical protein